jgi:hypothetical protein
MCEFFHFFSGNVLHFENFVHFMSMHAIHIKLLHSFHRYACGRDY